MPSTTRESSSPQRDDVIYRRRRLGRLLIRADDPSLTPFTAPASSDEVTPNLRLVELIDAELRAAGRLTPVKQRRRGLSPGELMVSIADAHIVGPECCDDSEVLRADGALAPRRAVTRGATSRRRLRS